MTFHMDIQNSLKQSPASRIKLILLQNLNQNHNQKQIPTLMHIQTPEVRTTILMTRRNQKSSQSSSSQQRNKHSGSAHKSSDRQKSEWEKQRYTPPEDYIIPEEKPSGSKGLVIFLAILFFIVVFIAKTSDDSSTSHSSRSYSGSYVYSQPTATKKSTPKPTQTKKPFAIADGLDVTFYNFYQNFNIVYNTKLADGITSFGSSKYSRTSVNKNCQLFFLKNVKGSIHTVILYLSFNANNTEELDNIGMSVISLVQAAIPDHVFTKTERDNAFDQIIKYESGYKYGDVTISINAWDQTGKDNKIWIVARKLDEFDRFGYFDLPKSTNGYSIEDLLFNGQSQIYGTEFSGFYLASDGKYYKTSTNKTSTAENISATPIPLKKKTGGYTEKDLISAGYVGKKMTDGTMFYEGFYIAPNGNYYPVGKNIPTLVPTEINYLATEIAENRYKEFYEKWDYYNP